ncbi:MAG: ABC transporter ATP-binding protein [Peptococcaceae bacterium]|nr:ABC transporter ATP-binding protein [Peptococcaceae bacterium]
MLLEVKNGCFGYNGKPILREINFTLEEHSVLTILGPNGAGKTTLLKCVMGFLKWQEGQTLLEDRPAESYTAKEFWQKISYVPQAKKSVFSYRVLDAVVMGLNANQNFFALPKPQDYQKAEEVLASIGAAKLAGKYCSELSGGELQMVMIARALISGPRLLVLDEPESNLDMKNQLSVLGVIEQAAHDFRTACLINTHFPNHALKISHRTLLLGYDNQQLLGDTLSVVTEANIQRFFSVCSKVLALEAENIRYHTIFPYKIAQGQ